MSLVINSNQAALTSQRFLAASGKDLEQAMERLSSGKRINSAGDDAAGLVLSNRMTSQVRGLQQAIRNANDGISLIQTAEGALDESTSILQRMRELSVQSANGIYSDGDRATLDAEMQQLVAELDRISESTTFNGQTLLDGKQGKIDLQVGAEANQIISIQVPAITADSLGLSAVNSDLIGAEIDLIGSSGALKTAIPSGSIKINGESLNGLSVGDSLQDLLDDVSSLTDITATAAIYAQADIVGDGILLGGDSLTLTGYDFSGNKSTFVIENTADLDEIADVINGQAQGVISASVANNGKLTLTSETLATIVVTDTTSGASASGMPQELVSKAVIPTIAADISNVIDGLKTDWIFEAEERIFAEYGLRADGVDLTLNLDVTDGAANTLGYVAIGGYDGNGKGLNLSLNLDMADFTNTNYPSGGGTTTATGIFSDRIVAHEMTHAIMARTMNMASLPLWFIEGAAEFTAGADERVTNVLGTLTAEQLADELSYATWTGSSAQYSAGYLAVKMMDAEIRNAGGNGIKDLMTELAAGSTLDVAINSVATDNSLTGSWTTEAEYITHFTTNGVGDGFISDTYLGAYINLGDVDTGSIAGSDYGGAPLDNADVMPNLDGGPVANNGSNDFNFIIPDKYLPIAQDSDVLADAQFNARLQLSHDSGNNIDITVGSSGTETELTVLGFRETSSSGEVTGLGLDNDTQATALASGDLSINGVAIVATSSAGGLQEKLDHINAVTEQTGVTASVIASESYQFAQGVQAIDLTTSTAFVSAQGVPYQSVEASDTIDFTSIAAGTFTAGSGVTFEISDMAGLTLTMRLDSSAGYSSQAHVVAAFNAYLKSAPAIDAGLDMEAYVSSSGKLGFRDMAGNGNRDISIGANFTDLGATAFQSGSINHLLGFDIEGLANSSDDDVLVGSGPAFEINGQNIDLSGAKNGDGTITAKEIAAAVNAEATTTGVEAYVDKNNRLHFVADKVFTMADDANGSGFLNTIDGGVTIKENPTLIAASSGSIIMNGSEVMLTDLNDLDTIINDINNAQSSTGVTAAIDDNGEVELSAQSSVRLDLGNTAGHAVAQSLGIEFIINSDGSADAVILDARLQLKSQSEGQGISVDVTSNGARATGLKNLNESAMASLLGTSLSSLSIATASGAQTAIAAVDQALESINSVRSEMGAVSNRLEFTVSNLMNISENSSAAKSRIMDADYAAETVRLSRSQVLQQASQAMLVQANSQPQQVLALLR